MATGLTPTTVGRGFPMKTSAGPRTTMAAGRDWRITDGSGSQAAIWTGARHGARGEPVETRSDGRPFLHGGRRLAMKGSQSAPPSTSGTISGPDIINSLTVALTGE